MTPQFLQVHSTDFKVKNMKTITGKSEEKLTKEMKQTYDSFLVDEQTLVQEHQGKDDSFSKLIMLFYEKIKQSKERKEQYDAYMSIKVLQLVYNTWKNKNNTDNTYNYDDVSELVVKPGVFSPQFASDSYLWAQHMVKTKVVEDKSVLEMGAGTGIISFYLHKYGNPIRVVAADINPHAIENMIENKKRLGIDDKTFSVINSDLYSDVQGTFDVIFWAYVWLKLEDQKMIDVVENEQDKVIKSLLDSVIDPKYDMLRTFLRKSKEHLTQDAKLLLITTDFMPNEFVKDMAESLGYTFSIEKFTEQTDVVKSAKMVLDLYQIELRLEK